jgi:L-iditol 2-dehydrogenase
MAAVVRGAAGVALRQVAAPGVVAPDDVVVEVRRAGICRTDLHVADGLLACAPPRVLGHELAGVVRACGVGVRRVAPGDRVTAIPFAPCGACGPCAANAPPHRCLAPAMLGWHRDGAFAEAVRVPERCVLPVPDGLDDARAAFVEPVAAALAVTRARLLPGQRGVVLGAGRILALCLRVLASEGIAAAPLDPDADGSPGAASLDFVVETAATEASLRLALTLLRPGGTLVLKSRPAGPVPLDVALAVRREVTVRAVAYGAFEDAIARLASGRLEVADLLGATYPLARYAEAFAEARRGEATKVFLAPAGEPCAA